MADRPHTVGLLGGGVIGGGWAARFALNGWDVLLFDPDPAAERAVGEVLANARRAIARLTLAPLPREGTVRIVPQVEEAVAGADFVQESVPEREDLKRTLLARASEAAGPDVVIASSTSGLLPTLLQRELRAPGRFCVGHPFNPVYLLPLVEVVGGAQTDPETTTHAAAVYRSLGMHPLVLRTEIDGFVADRLLEALWREALWLVADGVATVEEIDDAIRYGAGLRWSAMGTFLTYRIAGGEKGFRHFMEQFGPALAWPWTKLTAVPELTDELLDTLVAQSDEQAAGRSVRELERLRDDCLVSVIQALRTHGMGAGAVLAAYERTLLARAAPAADPDPAAPLVLVQTVMRPEWIDYNGHVNESRYLQVCSDATDRLLALLGLDADYLAATGSYFTVETHLSHLGPAHAGDRVEVATQVLGHDDKRLHLFHAVTRTTDGVTVATAEQMLVHVDAASGRAGPATEAVLERVSQLAQAHGRLPRPDRAGRRIEPPAGDSASSFRR